MDYPPQPFDHPPPPFHDADHWHHPPHHPLPPLALDMMPPPPPEHLPPHQRRGGGGVGSAVVRLLTGRSSASLRRVHPSDLAAAGGVGVGVGVGLNGGGGGCRRCRRCRRRAERRERARTRGSFVTTLALAASFASGGPGPFLLASPRMAVAAAAFSSSGAAATSAAAGRASLLARLPTTIEEEVHSPSTTNDSVGLFLFGVVDGTWSEPVGGKNGALQVTLPSLSSSSEPERPLERLFRGKGGISQARQVRPLNKLWDSPASSSALAATSSSTAEEIGDNGEEEEHGQPLRPYHAPLGRPHERAVFLFHLLAGLGLHALAACSRARCFSTTLTLRHIESIQATTWAGFILAVSFTEAWVKFRAPFLRKYVAVDVGRHVFAALNAAELAFAGAFWGGRWAIAGRMVATGAAA